MDQNTALLATAAAIAVGAGVIYRAVTLQQAGRRRRDAEDSQVSLTSRLQDIIMIGKFSGPLVLTSSPPHLPTILITLLIRIRKH